MDNMTHILKIGIIVVSAIVVIPAVLSGIAWLCLGLGLLFSEAPSAPEYTYGEFPYKLIYELNGENHIIEGEYICKYSGVQMNEGMGKYRTWVGYVNGTDEDCVYVYEDEDVVVYCYIGDAGYYMGDYRRSGHPEGEPLKPRLFANPKNGDIGMILSETDILDLYGIRLVEYSLSQPIINSFSE